jgi:hypothetical protein
MKPTANARMPFMLIQLTKHGAKKVLQVDSVLGSEAIWFDSCPFDFSMATRSLQLETKRFQTMV